MAAQYISDQIKTRGAKGVVDAADVAYSYKTEGIEQIDKSIKDVIDELIENIPEDLSQRISEIEENIGNSGISSDKINYTYTINGVTTTKPLNQFLDDIRGNENIFEKVQTVYNNAISTKGEIEDLKDEINNIVEETRDDIGKLKEISDSFNTTFDADATFEIVSTQRYNAAAVAGELSPNCIYFCYD